MKKFLSLALALVMSLSLLTVGAGATEYKDLTDKNEIQYEEAVAVLNKLGIITGYENGSFKPTGALTRGAAAKIIVSLMIGSEAAANLTVNAAPYKDVPVTNTFAAVISYCKTAGYINGYADGTFRPTASLTGYAFSKMLLGALGYNGKTEGFTGSGWTMNVAKLGNKAGLFNDFATAFKPNDGLNREAACLLALNTLKATEVEYDGNNVNVVGDGINVSVGNTSYKYVTSNNKNINQNIGKNKDNQSSEYTLEFGEEHFTDLKLTANGNAEDDFGRPSNEWSYKNSKIGTYAATADKTYTTEADGDTDADKVKDMGLKDYKVSKDYYYVNGEQVKFKSTKDAAKLNEIANLTANGVLVEAYLDDDDADTVETFVVIKTQMMQVKSVKSSEVTLSAIDDNGSDFVLTKNVDAVKDDDDAFNTLKGLKTDDYVLVVPVKDGSTYKVDSVAIPQSVTGKLTNIATKSGNTAVKAITVAGTAYKMSKLWNSEDNKLTTKTKLSTTQDTTVYLDKYGYAIYVKDVTNSKSTIIIDEIYSSLVDGKIVKYAKGWNSDGDPLELNLGNNPKYPDNVIGKAENTETSVQGKVFEYETSTSNSADYALVQPKKTFDADSKAMVYTPDGKQNIVAGQYQGTIDIAKDKKLPFDSDVKFIFMSCDYKYDETGKIITGIDDVTGITVNKGVTEVGTKDKPYNLTYILNDKCDKIVAVVVPNDDDSANTANLLYVQKVTGYKNNTEGKRVALFTAYIDGQKVTDCEYNKEALDGNSFYTYSKNESTGVYSLTSYNKQSKQTAVWKDQLNSGSFDKLADDYFFSTAKGTNVNGGNVKDLALNAKNAVIVDLDTDDGITYTSVKDMRDAIGHDIDANTGNKVTGFKVSYIFNGSDNAGSGKVAYLFITDTLSSDAPIEATGKYSSVVDSDVDGASALDMSTANYEITASYKIKMNVVAGQNLQTQVKEFLAYKGYKDIGNMTFKNSMYEITAMNPDGILVTLTMDVPENTNTIALVTVGTTKFYKVATTTVADLSINKADGLSYVKVSKGTPYVLNNSTDKVINGATYAVEKYYQVTMKAVDNSTVTTELNGNKVTATVPADTYVKADTKVAVALGVTPADSAANVTAAIKGKITVTGATGASALDSAIDIIAKDTAVIVDGKATVEVTLSTFTAAKVEITLELSK